MAVCSIGPSAICVESISCWVGLESDMESMPQLPLQPSYTWPETKF